MPTATRGIERHEALPDERTAVFRVEQDKWQVLPLSTPMQVDAGRQERAKNKSREDEAPIKHTAYKPVKTEVEPEDEFSARMKSWSKDAADIARRNVDKAKAGEERP